MSFLKKGKAHLKTAKIYAQESKARRLKVGAVLIRDDRVILTAYNGTPTGADNNCEDEFIGDNGETILVTKDSVIHAEANIISFAAKYGISTQGCILILTHSPCYTCSKLIIQSGIKKVLYDEPYRDTSAIKFLRDNNIIIGELHED